MSAAAMTSSPQDLAPLLEAFVGRQHRGCALIAPVDKLEENIAPLWLTGR